MLFAFLQRIKSNSGASASWGRCARKLRNTATCKANSEGTKRNWSGNMQCCKGKGGMDTNENDENILQLCSVTVMLNGDLTTHCTISFHTIRIHIIVFQCYSIVYHGHCLVISVHPAFRPFPILKRHQTESFIQLELSPGPSSHRSDDWENPGRGCKSPWTLKLNMALQQKTAGKKWKPLSLNETCQTYNI